MNGSSRRARQVPIAPKLLGAAGLLPPLIAIIARLAAGGGEPVAGALLKLAIFYAMLVLSFLGGIWWGVASARAPEEKQSQLLVLAIAPPLAALALFILTTPLPLLATILLAILLAASPLADAWLASMELTPPWWMRLRVPLSLIMGALVLVLALLLWI
ncbi:MAG TPA: DUF3429 family protein [Sphingomonas sp.]|nr:DUF3429 family protein [Sphingomonas sp.]